jgi:hypothetical protein
MLKAISGSSPNVGLSNHAKTGVRLSLYKGLIFIQFTVDGTDSSRKQGNFLTAPFLTKRLVQDGPLSSPNMASRGLKGF